MPAYYSTELLDEMETEAIAAQERLAIWCGTVTYNNMLHLGKSDYTLKQHIDAYRKYYNNKDV